MTASPFNMSAPPDVFRSRRAKLAAVLERPLLIPAGHARARNYTGNDFPFRAASTYRYFGGPPIEGAAWLIEPAGNGDDTARLARPTPGSDDSVWLGKSPGDDVIAAAAGVCESQLIAPENVESHLSGRSRGVLSVPCPATIEWAASLRLEPATADEMLRIIEMRLIKDEHELAAMRSAAKVAVDAHTAAWRSTAPDRREASVAAAFNAVLFENECTPSFNAIVTVRGHILHCLGYGGTMRSGNLLLVDGGAEELGGYASDVTRVAPVAGDFTQIQRHIYDTVLRAERAAVAECAPGRRFRDIHDLAARIICEGLVESDLLRGDPADLAERKVHTLFFNHGLGHLIGRDVHDMEDFGDLAGYSAGRTRRTGFGDKFLRLDRDLEPGMTVTIEPGVYFVPAIWERDDLVGPFAECVNRPAVDDLVASGFGGIRLEDDIHVRATGGPENLTEALPIDADEVAACVNTA